MNLDLEIQAVLNDFASRMLRDEADKDYITARIVHSLQFDVQFLWSSEQAIEKYFKAILLFNGESAKGLWHNLLEAQKRIKSIKDLKFRLPPDTQDFVEYVNEYGTNRYLEFTTHIRMNALIELDKAVSFIRRYCFFMGNGQRRIAHLAHLNSLPLDADPYHISSGYLERVLAKRNSKARQALIWKNLFFGRHSKKPVFYTIRGGALTPTQDIHEEWFEILKGFVDFPELKRRAKKEAAALKKGGH
jgi:HEPN domain-containing protein